MPSLPLGSARRRSAAAHHACLSSVARISHKLYQLWELDRSIEKRVRGSTVEKCGDRPCLLGEEGERAEEEEHEQHAGVLEVDEAVRADPGAAGEDAAAELQAHVQERAAGHQVELQQAGALGEGVPRADAERRRVGGEARDAGPHPPQAHRQEQRPRQDVAVERPHFGARRRAALLGSARLGSLGRRITAKRGPGRETSVDQSIRGNVLPRRRRPPAPVAWRGRRDWG
uniref:Uncharacterized protein n=1 Tax=Zea mays TaxID=4577 RepID=A0A804UAU6_MAIZE